MRDRPLKQRLDRLSADRHHRLLQIPRQKPVILDMGHHIRIGRKPQIIQPLRDHRLIDDQPPTALIRRSTRSNSTRSVGFGPDLSPCVAISAGLSAAGSL